MLERVTMPGIEFPRLYIAENREDVRLARENGVPFVRWRHGKDKLIALMLMPVLKKMFPYIDWNRVSNAPKSKSIIVERPLSSNKEFYIEIEDDFHAAKYHHSDESYIPNMKDDEVFNVDVGYSNDYREFTGDGPTESIHEKVDLSVHVGDLSSQVNLDVLQNLKLMPKFIGDIMDCIKTNIVAGTLWNEGWNKKKGAAVGNFDRTGELRNLIIVDISGSIPIGISSTMLTLIDTLRSQVHADLIITGSKSRFYPYEGELPNPQEIRNTIFRNNEAKEFYAILRDHIAGHHYGHVISFGDDDCPANHVRFLSKEEGQKPFMAGTIVEHVHHYHVHSCDRDTGYALWTNELANEPLKSYDTSWCSVIYN